MNVHCDTVLRSGSLLHILPLTVPDNLAYRNKMHAYAANSRRPRLCESSLAVLALLTRRACLMIPARMQTGLKCEKRAMGCTHANICRGHSIIRINM